MAKRLVIAQGKHDYVATLEDACRELGYTEEAQADRLTRLATHCKINRNTLLANLAKPGPPEPQTLRTLRKGTGIPMATWYMRLGILDADDSARALSYDAPPPLLSEPQQQALDLIEGLAPQDALEYLDHWRQTPARGARTKPQGARAHSLGRRRAARASAILRP